MRTRPAGLVLAIMICSSHAAAQQKPAARQFSPDIAAPVELKRVQRLLLHVESGASVRRHFAPDYARDLSVDFFGPSLEPASVSPQPIDVPAALASLRVTAERSSFLTEARIPIAEAWGGRLRLSGVQQRFHAANLFSAVNPAYWAEIAVASGAESVVGRPRVNYGVGVQFRF